MRSWSRTEIIAERFQSRKQTGRLINAIVVTDTVNRLENKKHGMRVEPLEQAIGKGKGTEITTGTVQK